MNEEGERRKRLHALRQSRLDQKRIKLDKLKTELQTLAYDEDVSVRQLASRSPVKPSGGTPSSRTAVTPIKNVVVTLPQMTTRKHRSPQQPEALSGRAEANTLSRIAQLQKDGVWIDKKLSKLVVPNRPKTHWDYVLEEMSWMSTVFQQEIKGKKLVSRKCAKMVQKHFSDKAMAVKRAEREHQQNLRRIAGFAAREVRTFWGNIEKLFEFRLKNQIEQKRKRALDEHLNLIVEKTEKYSNLLSESMADSSMKTTPVASDAETVREDDEYNPSEDSDDDERTIAKDEDQHEDGEVDALKEEGDLPIEELLKMYYPEAGEISVPPSSKASSTRSGRTERLRNRNRSAAASPKSVDSADASAEESEGPNDDDESVAQDDTTAENTEEESEMEEEEDEDAAEEEETENDTKILVQEEDDEKFYDVIEMAAKFQPTGNTLDTTSVKTKVPFLLKHTLREYQHIGLDWLVSMYERNLNGILADEMGLGKTIQTIALLAHLACERELWGPHLIIVPTSVMLNWEMEIKKWCPAFKVLTYYGSQKERRLKRVGWTKPNSFHVCITSYKLVIQDHASFRRKQWHYLILDEAQHIKNFKSQRWQLLLNFQSAGRLLLTGTPLQNNLMELWSLMHFLMPNVFESHRNFKEWFSNPLTGMVEGSAEYNDGLIKRLHKVLRPFLLRRLKNEVEKQLPKKYEHVVRCPLSKRQRFLYDDFMSRANTKDTLKSGNLLSVINVLMQLRKVCNHPNLFEPRPTVSPFVTVSADCSLHSKFCGLTDQSPIEELNLTYHPLSMLDHEGSVSGYAAFRACKLKVPKVPLLDYLTKNKAFHPVKCPEGRIRLVLKPTTNQNQGIVLKGTGDRIPMSTILKSGLWQLKKSDLVIKTTQGSFVLGRSRPNISVINATKKDNAFSDYYNKNCVLVENGHVDAVAAGTAVNGDASSEESDEEEREEPPRGIFTSKLFSNHSMSKVVPKSDKKFETKLSDERSKSSHRFCETNELKCLGKPLYGEDLIESISFARCPVKKCFDSVSCGEQSMVEGRLNMKSEHYTMFDFSNVCQSQEDVIERYQPFARRFLLYVPPCVTTQTKLPTLTVEDSFKQAVNERNEGLTKMTEKVSNALMLQLPETRLIQYDCGKLQVMSKLLRQLKDEGHRVLIFTQMTKVLDVLEAFLSFHGFIYLRLDGSTRVEQRQTLMERFNNNSKYFVFILSTRSGGVGINLTGADTVIFYDSDWNPTMDAQAPRSLPSYRTDPRRAYLQVSERANRRREHPKESQSEEIARRPCH